MTNEKSKSICKLNLDIGIHVEDVHEIGKRKEDLWMDVCQHFNYRSPPSLLKETEKDTYVCRMYTKNLENCKGCPAYQP